MADPALKNARITSQVLFFSLFAGGILFGGMSFWPLPEKFFFLIDPLVTFVTLFSVQTIAVHAIVLSCAVLLLSVVFGRFFCGWVCPMGTLIDIFQWFTKGIPRKQPRLELIGKLRLIKFGILIFVILASGVSFQFIYLFDPMVIMTRFAGMVFLPVKHCIGDHSPFLIQHSTQFVVYVFGILLLSLTSKRFWCRVVCPLGALFGLVGRYSIFGISQGDCEGCTRCHRQCPTGSVREPRRQTIYPEECIRCFHCLSTCRTSSLTFGSQQTLSTQVEAAGLSRRTVLVWLGSGILGPLIFKPQALGSSRLKSTLRPPHAPDEEDFLNMCIRCQACTQVCPTNALQPIFMQSGLYGLWSPSLMPDIGACRTDCNLCGAVCPTGAIVNFDMQSKYTVKIGTAILLKNRCVSYADGKPCGKCMPECPTGAIAFIREQDMDKPARIDFLLCVGCGICQNICGKETLGPAALIVTAKGRNLPSGVPQKTIDRLTKTAHGNYPTKKGDKP